MRTDKRPLRAELLAARRGRATEERVRAGSALASVLLAAPEVVGARVVAGYVGIGTEPPTLPLLERLRERGIEVQLPVLMDDNDLDWVTFSGTDRLAEARRGLLEPLGPRLGVDAVASADVVLCPGLAVGRDGMRLGRGGGSYDRVLARLGKAWTCVLLYDNEILDAIPADAHDRLVAAAATPAGLTRF